MSIWISDRLLRSATCLIAPVMLAGCLEGFSGPRTAPEVLRVAGDSVTIGGPRGYCIDPAASRDNARGTFVLMGSCATLNPGAGAARPDRLAVLTATVAAEPSGGPRFIEMAAEIAGALDSGAGRTALSRSGNPETVDVLETTIRDGILFVHLRDTSPFDGANVAPEYWRAVMEVGGRMVILSVIPLQEPVLSSVAVEAILENFVMRVLRENAPASPAPLLQGTQQAGLAYAAPLSSPQG